MWPINLAVRSIILVFGLGAVALFVAPFVQSEPARKQICIDDHETKERIRKIIMEGVELGLRTHIDKVFEIWIKDPQDQPNRAARGTYDGVSAYVRARRAVLNWSPPLC